MTDLNEIKLFIGIKIVRYEKRITLDQSAYIKTILEKFKMADCKTISTPLESKLNYIALNSDEKCDAPCRNLIGCLMYLMICTRPDLSTAVNILNRYSKKNIKNCGKVSKEYLVYYVPRRTKRVIAQRARNARRRSKPRRDQSCEHCRESLNFPNCVHWHVLYFM